MPKSTTASPTACPSWRRWSACRPKRSAIKQAKDALGETQARIYAIATVHKRLYSSGDVRFVALDEYLSGLLEQLETSMRDKGMARCSNYELEPLRLPTDATINLGVVVTEWVTNAFKYAYPGHAGEVRVRLRRLNEGRVELAVEDDGVGRNDERVRQGHRPRHPHRQCDGGEHECGDRVHEASARDDGAADFLVAS